MIIQTYECDQCGAAASSSTFPAGWVDKSPAHYCDGCAGGDVARIQAKRAELAAATDAEAQALGFTNAAVMKQLDAVLAIKEIEAVAVADTVAKK